MYFPYPFDRQYSNKYALDCLLLIPKMQKLPDVEGGNTPSHPPPPPRSLRSPAGILPLETDAYFVNIYFPINLG